MSIVYQSSQGFACIAAVAKSKNLGETVAVAAVVDSRNYFESFGAELVLVVVAAVVVGR